MAAELVNHQIAVLVAVGGDPSALAAKAATSKIPIVFAIGGTDPVELGLVASFNRPGANVTGISLLPSPLDGKRLDLLHELVPSAAVISALLNPNYQQAVAQTRNLREAARAIGRRLQILNASTDTDLESAFATLLQQRAEALWIAGDPFFDTRRDRIIALAARHRIPAIYQSGDYALAGGLISYGASFTDGYRQVGVYAGRILKGAKPSDLPVMQSTRFELVINLKTANALGLTIPQSILLRADEVIE